MKSSTSRDSISTSWHLLSADQRLTKFQRIIWILYNLHNNALPQVCVDRRLIKCKFGLSEKELDRLWDDVADVATPARRLCDLFWMSLPWTNLLTELESARILEIGCGTGDYGRLLQRILGDGFKHYLGVDIEVREEWNLLSSDTHFSFEVGRAENAKDYLPGRNLIFTQSALEHFTEDLYFFREVSNYIASSRDPILQIHLIPSASCLRTFVWHGIRNYTPRTISKITRLFDANTQIYLFTLGDRRSNSVHWQYITWPYYRHGNDLRSVKLHEYQQALRLALLRDFGSGQTKPAFYALVLISNFEEDFFDGQKFTG